MRDRNARSVRRLAIAFALALSLLAIGAQSAFADSAQLTITNTAGQPDPAADLARVFTVAGASATPESLYVKYRATGGAPCAPSANSDTGTYLDGFVGRSTNGSYTYSTVVTWDGPGPELFCMWLASGSAAITTPISQVVTFRGPTGSITAALNPVAPQPKQSTTITVSGSSEAPKTVYVKYRAAGTACAATYSSDTGTGLITGTSANGAFSITDVETFDAGSYVLCLWLADSSSDPAPTAGPQQVPFVVAAPPPPPPPPPPTILATKLRSKFPTVAHHLRMTVWSQVTATGAIPKGQCWLQLFTNHQWRTAGAHTPVTAKGICEIFTRFTYPGGKRFRVSFRPGTGFKESFGPSAWVVAKRR